MSANQDTGSNGRITLALVQKTALENSEKIDTILRRLERYVEVSEARIRALESTQARHDERIIQNKKEVEQLSKKSNTIDALVAIAVAIGTLLGLTRGP